MECIYSLLKSFVLPGSLSASRILPKFPSHTSYTFLFPHIPSTYPLPAIPPPSLSQTKPKHTKPKISKMRQKLTIQPPFSSPFHQLTTQTQISTMAQSSRASAGAIAAADAEIARFRDILRQIDELEVEFDKVRHIRDIVKGFRVRVEGLERRVR